MINYTLCNVRAGSLLSTDRSTHIRKGPAAAVLLRTGAALLWLSGLCFVCEAGILKQQSYSVHDSADRAIADFLKERDIRDIYTWRDWMARNIRYIKDFGDDVWSAPMVTLKRGFGDCEDYAILNRAVLRALGNTADIYVVERWGSSHAVCVFRYDIGGTLYWGYTDNDRFVITEEADFKRFSRQLMDSNGYSGLTKYSQRHQKRKAGAR